MKIKIFKLNNLVLTLIVVLITYFSCVARNANISNENSLNIYISVKGDDQNPGTEDKPVKTFVRARDIIRDIKGKKSDKPINVIVYGGVYNFNDTLLLTPADSGAEQSPVTWKAKDGEKVLIRGGKKVEGWKLWKNGIYKTDLKSQGLSGIKFHQLFYKSKSTDNNGFAKRQIVARYPDFDPQHPRTGGNVYTSGKSQKPWEELVFSPKDIPFDKWSDISQAEIVSTYNRGWNFAITPIKSVDIKIGIISVRPVRMSQANAERGSGEFIKMNRFYVQNVLEALDTAGEWYLDYKTNELYFYPPDGKIDGDVIVPTIDNIIEVKGSIPYPHGYLNIKWRESREKYPFAGGNDDPVKYLVFEGFDFECVSQDAIRMSGTQDCHIIRCRVTNSGNIGINLGAVTSSFDEIGNPRVTKATGFEAGAGAAGQILLFNDPCRRCRVIGCDVWDIGCEGIMLYGTANVAENNHIYDVGLYDKDCPCINVFGEKNIVKRNTLHDCPRCAIFLKGIDNLIELNNIHHAVLETTDMGAIRMVQRNIYLKGNIIRYNKIFDVPGYGFDYETATHFQSPFYTFGIYLDDFTCGTEMYGNIISHTGRAGIMIHGGGENYAFNNIIVNAGNYQVELAPIPERNPSGSGLRPKCFKDAFNGNKVERNVLVCTEKNSVPYRFTRPDTWGGYKVSFANNIINSGSNPVAVILMDNRAVTWNEWMDMKMDIGSILSDAVFENDANGDYRLKNDSKAKSLGFKDIPLKEIGCYKSQERASWPISPDSERFREKPVLHASKDYDASKDYTPELIFSKTVIADFEANKYVSKERAD